MSVLANTHQQMNRAKPQRRHNSTQDAPLSSSREHATDNSETTLTSGSIHAPTWPATKYASRPPSERSETTILGEPYDSGKFDIASSVTLQDESPWHESSVDKHTQQIPPMILPTLLHGVSDLSSSQSSLDEREYEPRKVNERSGCSGDAVPRYSAVQKEKWRAGKDDDVTHGSRWPNRSPSPQLLLDNIHNPVEDWVVHNRPILQDYADRQTSLPLGRRLHVSIDEPSEYILGAIQLLVNRDQRGSTEHSRQLGPQLVENFVDIDCWMREYFRSRHGSRAIDRDVSTLLTIVINNFYEGQVQLIDRLVDFALENMRFCGRSKLGIEDFTFGFDFKMSQDLPFYVETSSRVRKPLPIRGVELRPTLGPVTTNSGRQVKPTQRAQAAATEVQTNASGRRNKGKNTSQVKEKQTQNSSTPPVRQRKGSARPIADHRSPGTSLPPQADPHAAVPVLVKTNSEGRNCPPIQPSNLGLPSTSSTPGNAAPRLNDSSEPKASTSVSANGPKITHSSGPHVTACSPSRLRITVPTASGPGSNQNNLMRSRDTLGKTNRGQGRGAPRSASARIRGPRHGRGRGRGDRGNGSLALRAEIPEVMPDSNDALSLVADNAAASATVDQSVAHPALTDALIGTTGTTCGAGSHPCDEGQGVHTGEPLLSQNDPGHPQGKKRKLDDYEDHSVSKPGAG